MLTQKIQNNKHTANKNIILEAEIDSQNLLPDEYDHAQIEARIQTKDYQVEILNSLGQSSCLVGIQVISTQYLLSVGTVGLYPISIALLPVLGSVLTTLTNFSFSNGIQIEDKSKLPAQVLRTSALLTSATKLIGDARAMDDIASKSFQVVVKQEREYRNLPEPQKFDLLLPGIAFLLLVIASISAKRKR
ncbi:hypothetical protein H6G54_05240 [Anabaena cylindrica FACHB-243]|uniref:Uncharacterized protein n=1 Tax=Anabaena cylindrica (strain ATCC 27899 / PCC 7122) TaxID=272123 RepID=K9ZPV3_ANACC|nr:MULTISPECIES: hypothetical protein [Anabaena]AFZ60824.1 hypothetical protein Anacy_5512 [Anabaena cylindrica PCC 7122]MBD2417124.1 hypothetical protein [Anabaena cylindrica FACHB-243]MBY5280820.1 hypothetical protein [Anabaena sp. CCAP 1446/1C]MBY5307096.1 hypothetical protein [Anabaena sp. CCAP 1446/1C]MCM2406825.1 hypothetical protein [Anabaena sp. CCAP 1446/1C]